MKNFYNILLCDISSHISDKYSSSNKQTNKGKQKENVHALYIDMLPLWRWDQSAKESGEINNIYLENQRIVSSISIPAKQSGLWVGLVSPDPLGDP